MSCWNWRRNWIPLYQDAHGMTMECGHHVGNINTSLPGMQGDIITRMVLDYEPAFPCHMFPAVTQLHSARS